MSSYIPNASDGSKPLDSDDPSMGAGEFRALKTRVNQLAASAAIPVASTLNQSSLTNMIFPSADGQWRDIYRGGWKPAGFNQQWGGSQFGVELIDGATGTLNKFDAATGYVEDNASYPVGDVAISTYRSQGLKVSEAISVSGIWLKMYKVGNPANNLQVTLVADDGTGNKPLNTVPITNGTATSQSGKLHTSKTDGEWYRFVFATPPTLAANTQYHILIKSSGAVDATNYWQLKFNALTKKYPGGSECSGDAVPVFTSLPTYAILFLVEPVSTYQFLQLSTGQFDSAIKFTHGSPVNQHKALTQPLRNFFDGKSFTALHRVSSCLKGAPIAEYMYGLDHDRFSLQCNAGTGYASLNFYDSTGTLVTVTGNTDVSGSTISDIAICARTYGDGQDYLQIWVNGVKQAETTLGTYVVDKNMRDLGTAWLGGGFALAPTWTQALTMATLPSANGWTWTGTGAEANCMSIQGGKLFQNKTGYAAADTGFYTKNVVFSNATGWAVEWKGRICNNTNTAVTVAYVPVTIIIRDGAKECFFNLQESFIQSAGTGTVDFTAQTDLKSQEHAILITGKGSDYYVYLDGKLIVDGTGKLTNPTALNAAFIGDITAVANENADAIHSYLKYYQGGTALPVIATGMLLHEYAFWSGNKSAILPTLYNSGTPYSVKAITGMARNYVEFVDIREEVGGVTINPTTASATAALLTDMEMFVLGDRFDIDSEMLHINGVAGNTTSHIVTADGVSYDNITVTTPVANYLTSTKAHKKLSAPLGLHKLETRWAVSGGTSTNSGIARKLSVRGVK